MSTPERLYTIEAPQARRQFDAHGNIQDVYDIFWIGPNGIQDKVTVNVSAYTPEVVDRMIKMQLQKHLDVMALGGS